MRNRPGRWARAFVVTLICAVYAATLDACGAGSNGASTPGGNRTDRLVIGQGREFNSLLPFANNGFTTDELIGLSFSLLVSLGPNGYEPDAALAIPTLANGGISRDGLTITYHLRHGIRWQDGQPLTARDVIFTQHYVMRPDTPVPYRDGFDRIASLRAPDSYTVIVRLKTRYRMFVVAFLGPDAPTGILPEHLLAHVSDVVHSDYARRPIGSGPYRIGDWMHGDSVTFTADPHWFRGRPAIGEIVVRFIPDPVTRLTQLRTHEIDAELVVSSQTADAARTIAGVRLDVATAPIFTQLSFNLHDPLFAQHAVRLAIARAIDRRRIAASISHGLFSGDGGARGAFLWAYDPTAGYPTYDPSAARRLLDAAGWHPAADGIRVAADGRRLAFTLSLRADRADENAAAIQIQQQLHAVGIDVGIKALSAPQFTANDSTIRTGKFSAALNSYFGYDEPDPTIYFACSARGLGGFNIAGYCDPAADAAMDASLRTYDRATVRRDLANAQRIINASLPMIFLWQGVDVSIVPQRLHGYADLLGTPFLNAGHWSLTR